MEASFVLDAVLSLPKLLWKFSCGKIESLFLRKSYFGYMEMASIDFEVSVFKIKSNEKFKMVGIMELLNCLSK